MEKSILLDMLSEISFGISDKGIIEETSLLVFDEGMLISYNDILAVSSPMPKEEEKFTCAVNATDFKKAVSSVRTKDIEITFSKETNKLTVMGGKTIVHLPISDPEKLINYYEALEISEIEDSFEEVPENFIDALKKASNVAGDNVSSRQGLSQIRFENGTLESCNGASFIKMNDGIEVEEALYLQKKEALAAIRFSPEKYAVSELWIHFMNENDAILSCRLAAKPENPFPNIEDIKKEKYLGSFTIKEELKETVNSICYFYDSLEQKEQGIEVHLHEKTMKIISKGSKGHAETEIDIKGTKDIDGVVLIINGNALSNALIGTEVSLYTNVMVCNNESECSMIAVKITIGTDDIPF